MRDAVGDAVDRVVRLVLQALEDVLVVRDQIVVHGRDVAPRDEPQRRVSRRGHAVVVPGAHERHHLVRGRPDLCIHGAARLLLEGLHPVVLEVARPRDQVDLALLLRVRLDLLDRRTEPFDLGTRAALVVSAAAASRNDCERGHEQPQHRPQRQAVPACIHTPSSSASSISDCCSGCHARRTRRPRTSSTCVEPSSRFCARTWSSSPRSSLTW